MDVVVCELDAVACEGSRRHFFRYTSVGYVWLTSRPVWGSNFYAHYTVLYCIVRVITKTTKALTFIYEYMNHTKNNTTGKILKASYLLLLFRRKKKVYSYDEWFHMAKTPFVAGVIYFVLVCVCFWLSVIKYTSFWRLPYSLRFLPDTRYIFCFIPFIKIAVLSPPPFAVVPS